jgi:hypothetical protein
MLAGSHSPVKGFRPESTPENPGREEFVELNVVLEGRRILATHWAVRAMERFSVRRVLIAGVVLLMTVAGLMWLPTSSLTVPLVAVLTALMGVPYAMVSFVFNQGMFISTRPQERGVAAGIFQTCRYVGAHHGHCADRRLRRRRRGPGKLGSDCADHAGTERPGVCGDAVVAGADGLVRCQ